MKTIGYFVISIAYVIGFIMLLDYLFKFQNTTFHHDFSSMLYPFLSMFFIGLYSYIPFLFYKLKQLGFRMSNKLYKFFMVLAGVFLLSVLMIKLHFYSYGILVVILFAGYIMSLVLGFLLTKNFTQLLERK